MRVLEILLVQSVALTTSKERSSNMSENGIKTKKDLFSTVTTWNLSRSKISISSRRTIDSNKKLRNSNSNNLQNNIKRKQTKHKSNAYKTNILLKKIVKPHLRAVKNIKTKETRNMIANKKLKTKNRNINTVLRRINHKIMKHFSNLSQNYLFYVTNAK